MESKEVAVFWFRRDLRIYDNAGLSKALDSELPVLPIFIFDDTILNNLEVDDSRVSFIYESLVKIRKKMKEYQSDLLIKKGNPILIWKELLEEFKVKKVYFNKDYEPYAIKRDTELINYFTQNNITVYAFKDQVIFEKNEILKKDGKPYTVFTPYKIKWLTYFNHSEFILPHYFCDLRALYSFEAYFPSVKEIGFNKSTIKVQPFKLKNLDSYHEHRDYPAKDNTSYVSTHLRFGTVSIREFIKLAKERNQIYLYELIWREFFMQILYHFPKVVTENFKPQYNGIQWRNNELEFKKWCNGETGYPLVDAGMRQLNRTGYMHNRVRMITASFLCKHLLIDWRWGEAYFSLKLLDFELASNNGNWQWSSGSGCDASPYFRIFNPTTQLKKFDKNLTYVRTWVKDFDEPSYPEPIVDHKMARLRAIEVYKQGLNSNY